LCRPSQLAERVKLKRGIAGESQKVVLGLHVGIVATVEIGVARCLGKDAGSRDGKFSASGVDTLCGNLQIVVMLERRADELLQLWIV